MRVFACLLILQSLSACREAPHGASAEVAAKQTAASSCRQEYFEASRFMRCAEPGGRIQVRGGYRRFADLRVEPARVAFAMNAGMFDEEGRAIGLLMENSEQKRAINRGEGGGNFHLMPNGVFLIRKDGAANVVTSKGFRPSSDIAFATQSGPLLLINGKLHPRFDPDGESRHIRNGVGVAPDGTPVFVISEEPVNFGKLARYYRDRVKAKDALYFDGSVSSLWDPAGGRQDSFAELGPMVIVFRRAS